MLAASGCDLPSTPLPIAAREAMAQQETVVSLAQFFSVMLELGETEHQIALRKQAEFRALQSQINPHFLFNALNTISALCMTDPDRVRELRRRLSI